LIEILRRTQEKGDFDFDNFTVNLILQIGIGIFQMVKQVTSYPDLHPDLIASGLAWQAFRHCFYNLRQFR
jgi:hypothetical protein